MSWFERLTGFAEAGPEETRALLALEGECLTSRANGRKMTCGRLEMPSLGALRARAAPPAPGARPRLGQVIADVTALHRDPENAGAAFQVASQFNLLEMVGPQVTPAQGIAGYEHDRTQGPACAVACGAGTIYRNYLVPVDGQQGQTGGAQIDCLADLGAALGNTGGRLWRMQNGYALPEPGGLEEVGARLAAMSAAERDALRARLRVGVQHMTEVTLPGAGHLVTQIYCSALPVAYGGGPAAAWEGFARLVLEAAYEATLLAARENAAATGNPRLYLTLLGGGAFGNDKAWILSALRRALARSAGDGLDLRVVSYGGPDRAVEALIADLSA